MQIQRSYGVAAFAALCLSACGGDGGSSGGSGGGPVTPGPVTPGPNPTPINPTPINPTPATTRYQAEASGPMIARLDFVRTGAALGSTPSFNVNTNRAGVFVVGQTDGLPGSGSSGLNIGNGEPVNDVIARGFDVASTLFVRGGAPTGGTVVSPVGDLLRLGVDQARVKTALGLDTGPFRLVTDRDLRSFSAANGFASPADRSDAAALAAANIRLIVLADALAIFRAGAGATVPAPLHLASTDFEAIATFVRTNPSARLFQGGTADLLRANRSGTAEWREEAIVAFAQLIDRYAAAIGTEADQEATRARWMLGIRGALVPRLLDLRRDNSAAAVTAANAVTAVDFQLATVAFVGGRPTIGATAFLVPQPDFVVAAQGARIELARSLGAAPGDLSYGENDLGFTTAGPERVGFDLISVSVPSANTGAVQASAIGGQTIQVQLAPGFRGTTWFDYRIRGQNGEEADGRVFVTTR